MYPLDFEEFLMANGVGEVDFLIDDYDTLSTMPIEVKSGKDYTVHSALDRLLSISDYGIKSAIVFSNDRNVRQEGCILYLPIYYVMFLDNTIANPASPIYF